MPMFIKLFYYHEEDWNKEEERSEPYGVSVSSVRPCASVCVCVCVGGYVGVCVCVCVFI